MIDWSQIKALRNEVGEDDFDEVLGLFIEETEEVLGALTEHSQLELLHFLKGSALTLGFRDLADACAAVEAGSKDQFALIKPTYTASKAALLRQISSDQTNL